MHFRVIHVVAAQARNNGDSKMTFTIDTENKISAFATQEEAAASTTNPRTDATGQHLAGGAIGRHQEQPAGSRAG